MVVAAGGDKGRLVAGTLLQLEPEDAAVESKGAFKVGDLEMDVTDVDAQADR